MLVGFGETGAFVSGEGSRRDVGSDVGCGVAKRDRVGVEVGNGVGEGVGNGSGEAKRGRVGVDVGNCVSKGVGAGVAKRGRVGVGVGNRVDGNGGVGSGVSIRWTVGTSVGNGVGCAVVVVCIEGYVVSEEVGSAVGMGEKQPKEAGGSLDTAHTFSFTQS